MTNLPWMNILDAQSGAMNCGSSEDLACRDTESAKHLKGAAIASILALGAFGVATPLLGKRVKYLKSDGNFFFIAKAFAAGVILATGFVHMMPDAMGALTSDCLPRFPWSKFPFAGFVSMLAALVTLIVDFLATQFYEQKRSHGNHDHHAPLQPETEGYAAFESIVTRVASKTNKVHDTGRHDDSSAQIHIVGIRAHAVSHSHSHPEGHHECIDASHEHVHGHVGHSHHTEAPDEGSQQIRHVVISQVLELGILAHSVIIGVSLGVSQSPCTIRPLIAALTFHQFFEGFALGGCISQAEFTNMAAAMMAFFFTVTTPLGVVIGILISEGYNAGSPTALIVEGVFDSISAGILIYMSLVDLIAADFLSKRMRCNRQLQVGSYIALLAGASAMSMLAIWA